MALTDESAGALLSIGEVAEATGISPDTIRVWERRYGKPRPTRLPSGHRRYTSDQVRWLRRVAEALAGGHRAAAVVQATDKQLEDLLQPEDVAKAELDEIQRLLEHVRAYLRKELVDAFEADWDALGPAAFLAERVAPLLTAVGRAWADGRLDIRHEHFVTEVLEDTLRSFRFRLSAAVDGPRVVLATLPGEGHGLGLQIVGVMCALDGIRASNLGVDIPLDEIARAARETDATAVAISVSLATGGIETDRKLAALRRLLPPGVQLAVGGRGARGVRRGPRGIRYIKDLDELARWLRSLRK